MERVTSKVLCVDPGSAVSSVVLVGQSRPMAPAVEILEFWTRIENAAALEVLANQFCPVVCEWLRLHKDAGSSTLQTALAIGRFCQVTRQGNRPFGLLHRAAVKKSLGLKARAKDSEVRSELLGRHVASGKTGQGVPSPIGTKDAPGPLYGVSRDTWSALAIAHAIREGAPIQWVM